MIMKVCRGEPGPPRHREGGPRRKNSQDSVVSWQARVESTAGRTEHSMAVPLTPFSRGGSRNMEAPVIPTRGPFRDIKFIS